MTAARYAAEIVGTDIPHLDEGRYNAKLDGLEVTSTKYGAAFKFHWLVEVPGEGPFELSQLTSTATTGGSRAGQTIKALLGRLLAPGEKLATNLLAGKTAVLDLSVGENGWNRVEDVYPAPPPPSAPTPVAAEDLPF